MYVSYKTHTYTYLVYDQVYTAVPAVLYKVPMACTRQACTAHQLQDTSKACTTQSVVSCISRYYCYLD